MSEATERLSWWPVDRLKYYPLDSHWSPEWPKHRISSVSYQKTLGCLRTLAIQPEYVDMMRHLRDFCFQQGGECSNACADDKEIFDDILTNDLLFFVGNRNHELIQDFPLDPKVYSSLPYMKASHFDFYRVLRRGWLGAAQVESLTTGEKLAVKVSISHGPSVGDVIFGRFMKLRFTTQLSESWITIPSEFLESVLQQFDDEYNHAKKRFEELTKRAFLKIAAYHVYESIVGRVLIKSLTRSFDEGVRFLPQVTDYVFRSGADIPKLETLPGAESVDEESEGGSRVCLVTLCISDKKSIKKTLREAIVSREDKKLEIISFISLENVDFRETIESKFGCPMTHVIKREHPLGINEVYRCLRHLRR